MNFKAVAIVAFATLLSNGNNCQETKWLAPDAWGRVKPNKQLNTITYAHTKLPAKPSTHVSVELDGDSTKLLYGKLLHFIFDRKRMKLDASTSQFTRGIVFKVTETQLNVLEASNDPREWDSVLAEILTKSSQETYAPTCEFFSNFFLSIEHFIRLHFTTEISFWILLLGFFLAIIFFHKKYKYRLVSIILTGSITFGIINSYYECNKELEISQLVKGVSNMDNPCAYEERTSWIFFFHDYYQQKCVNHLKENYRYKWPYCDPGQVILKYLNDIIFNQILSCIEKTTEVVRKCFEIFSFPYNLLAVLILGLSLPHLVKVLLKYFFVPVVNSCLHQNEVLRKYPNDDDQLTGENLRLFLENIQVFKKIENDTIVEKQEPTCADSFQEKSTKM